MSDQLTTRPVIVINSAEPRPICFAFRPGSHLLTAISRFEVANIATALAAAAPDPKVREGVALLAVALGLEVIP